MQKPVSLSSGANPAGRHIALLIDADNVSHSKIAGILLELSKYGTPNIRRAYGDWTSKQLTGWTGKLHEYALRPIQQFAYSKGKNATDILLAIDAMELLHTQRLDGFAIASSDADFTPLVMHLKAAGHEVYGFGERKTPKPFVVACTTFLYLDTLVDAESESRIVDQPKLESAAPKSAKQIPARKVVAQAAAASLEKPDTPKIPTGKELAQDALLIAALRGGVEAYVGENGWAQMSAVGSAVKRLSSIDPRNFGRRSFTALFEDTGLFVIERVDSGQTFVADKRNKPKSLKPAT